MRDPNQSRFLYKGRGGVPLDWAITGTVGECATDRPTKLAAAYFVRRHVPKAGGRRRDAMMTLFAPHRPQQLPPGQRLGLIP